MPYRFDTGTLVDTSVHIYIYACTDTYINVIRTYVCTYVRTDLRTDVTYAQANVRLSTCMHTYIYAYACSQLSVHVYQHTYTCIYYVCITYDCFLHVDIEAYICVRFLILTAIPE